MKTGLLCFVLMFAIPAVAQVARPVYFGADLSYVNEMEDCGGFYRVSGTPVDPFVLFGDRGVNLARARLWHSPSWTSYSTLPDVRKTFQRATAVGMSTLLDFHYSDDWADPGKQRIPVAWQGLPFETLKDSLYRYTHSVLTELAAEGLLPEMVQIGNEINPGMLLPLGSKSNWTQLGDLINSGIAAVRNVETATGQPIKIMLHVAQPENVHQWIADAINVGNVTDFDAIGLSYYKSWSNVPLDQLPDYVSRLVTAFDREVILAETAYPWTLAGNDGANNILGSNAIEAGYPATPDGQKRYTVDLMQTVLDAGGSGIIYWEPAWISTGCSTQWGQGSHWENATFFDFNSGNEVLPAIDFPLHDYEYRGTVPVTLRVDMTGRDTTNGVFVAGDMTYDMSGDWQPIPMNHESSSIFSTTLQLHPRTAYRFAFHVGTASGQRKESLTVRCAGDRGINRLLSIPPEGGVFDYPYSSCAESELTDVVIQVDMGGIDTSGGVYIAGDLTKNATGNWTFRRMDSLGSNLFGTTVRLVRGGRYPFAFYTGTTWSSDEKESVPHLCATAWGTHRTLDVPGLNTVLTYRFGQCTVTTSTEVEKPESEGLGALLPHYPNPVSGTTTFAYNLSYPSYVTLSVYDLLGREVAVVDAGQRHASTYRIDFDTRSLPGGLYVYRLVAGTAVQTRSMIVL